MLTAKLRLSAEEQQLLLDERFILTKRSILEKTEQLFGNLSEVFRNEIKRCELEQESYAQLAPKIARGENYKGLPWVMMDYPRLFTRSDTCAIRCFFWWGNYCSITLHLSGLYQERYLSAILGFREEQQGLEDPWLYCIGEDPWEHEIRPDNYLAFTEAQADWMAQPFFKITKKIPLEKWDQLDEFFANNFKALLTILNYAPKR